jgi:hypothetical protein
MILTFTVFTSEDQPHTVKIAPRSARDELQAAIRTISFLRNLSKSIPMDIVSSQRQTPQPAAPTTTPASAVQDRALFEKAYLQLFLDETQFARLLEDPRLFPTLVKQYMKVS